jgi:hypothetical protein
MKRLKIIIEILSIFLILYGLGFSFLNRAFCRGFCQTCFDPQISNCSNLLLFVAIIFIVVGYSLHFTFNDLDKLKKI